MSYSILFFDSFFGHNYPVSETTSIMSSWARYEFYRLSIPMALIACALFSLAAAFLGMFDQLVLAKGFGIAAGICLAFGIMFFMLFLWENGCRPSCDILAKD